MIGEYISIILFAGDDIPCLEQCLGHILDYTGPRECELIIIAQNTSSSSA